MDSWHAQMRKGVVDLAILAQVGRGETYGYEIVENLRRYGGLEMTESTVYPALTRLARDGALAVRSAASPNGPPRRYYRLTDDGRDRLARMASGWSAMARSITLMLEGDP
ncbi:PadR family transcriptional regulator [Tundrisphaera sp. TA3]|uniref:PadR family transcriptional regulator n=1 Tax=Tundrisphaera sp. TA3 TaxID=3435775 RepID=UPI003EB78CC9